MKIIAAIYTIFFLAGVLFVNGAAQAQTSRPSPSITPLVQGNIVRQNSEPPRRQSEQARKKDSAGKKHDSGDSGAGENRDKRSGKGAKKP